MTKEEAEKKILRIMMFDKINDSYIIKDDKWLYCLICSYNIIFISDKEY